MNTKVVKKSIWLMLPVSIVLVYIMVLFQGDVTWETLWVVPFGILTYGAIIWIPSMIMTYSLETFFIDESSDLLRVILIFALETLLTFLIMAGLFGFAFYSVPLLALGMSVVIQAVRILIIWQNQNRKQQKSEKHLRVIH